MMEEAEWLNLSGSKRISIGLGSQHCFFGVLLALEVFCPRVPTLFLPFRAPRAISTRLYEVSVNMMTVGHTCVFHRQRNFCGTPFARQETKRKRSALSANLGSFSRVRLDLSRCQEGGLSCDSQAKQKRAKRRADRKICVVGQ